MEGREAFLRQQAAESRAIGGWGDVANCRVAAKLKVPIRSLANSLAADTS